MTTLSADYPRFHLAFPVTDLEAARAFYGGTLGCGTGRESDRWIDFDFFGHQLVAHLVAPEDHPSAATNAVDGHAVPASHFGVILDWDKYTKVGNVNWGAFADAIDCGYIPITNNNDVATGLRHALETAAQGQPVFVDIAIDYSRRSNYALGVVKANLAKFSGRDKLRIVSRAIVRKFIG